MDNVQVIDIVGVSEGWMKLMQHFQNHPHYQVFKVITPNKEEAIKVRHMLSEVIRRRPSWFDMIITSRGCDVYVVKLNRVRTVEVRHE